MSEVHVTPLINKHGSSEYILMDDGITHPLIVLNRVRLKQLIANAEAAMEDADKMILSPETPTGVSSE